MAVEDVRLALRSIRDEVDAGSFRRPGFIRLLEVAQALHARPDCRVVTLRGNVATLDMRQLMQQHATALACGPGAPIGRNQQSRRNCSNHRWNCGR